MENPMLSRHGHSFERSAILKWLQDHECCPMTRKPLRPSLLISNKNLAQEILAWRRLHFSEDKASKNSTDPPPQHFICPFTKDIMVHPVVSKYGDRFERSAIEDWFVEGYEFCPVSGKPLRPAGLVTDIRLMEEIKLWKMKNGYDVQNGHGETAESENPVQYGFVDAQFGDERSRIRAAYAA
jgi:hypothetical protein